jgi:pyruvate/oxaloacetate carboxyltransferase
MQLADMLPILPKMDSVGYWSLEVWGGATFDAALRFLDENPWENLRTIKKHCPKTPLQMLLRGQNLVGYHHYSDDIVRRFVHASKRNGMDIFRVFDALNDIRNVEVSAEAVKECGGHFEGAISYTVSPVHTLDAYLEYAQQLKELGADTICIKDMAGMLTPFRTEKMVRALKEQIGLPVVVSSALETSVGIAAGLALAGALPELPYACGLATLQLLTGDVTSTPLTVVGGALPVVRPVPDAVEPADQGTAQRWRDRLRAVQARQGR